MKGRRGQDRVANRPDAPIHPLNAALPFAELRARVGFFRRPHPLAVRVATALEGGCNPCPGEGDYLLTWFDATEMRNFYAGKRLRQQELEDRPKRQNQQAEHPKHNEAASTLV